jgi:hypothetical protein
MTAHFTGLVPALQLLGLTSFMDLNLNVGFHLKRFHVCCIELDDKSCKMRMKSFKSTILIYYEYEIHPVNYGVIIVVDARINRNNLI